jgi:NAD(P)-dependent dehydrogenase (short-subunit alcohol dehydrogenase family)
LGLFNKLKESEMLDLTGKVAFVAGAGSVGEGWGNGRATAVLLARQGAKVYGVDLSEKALEGTTKAMQAEGHTHWVPRTGNMTVSTDVKSAVDDCVERFGKIDILINNIGGSAAGDPVTMSEEVWDSQMDLNLKTAYMGCKHVIPVMVRQFEETGRGGAIVNLSSIAHMSHHVNGRVNVAYAAAKAGLGAFGRATAIAYVKKGIRVNTVVVGTMNTPLVSVRLVKQLDTNLDDLIAKRNASIPMGHMGEAWDIANAVLFLASDESKYITATQLVVDGGVTAAR